MLALLACLARHSGSHWCFQFLASILNGFFEFLFLWVNEINSSQFSCVVKMELLMLPLLLLFSLAFLPILPQSSGHKWSGPDVTCRFVSLSSDHIYPSGSFSSNRVNWVKPVQESDKSLDPSMFNSRRCGVLVWRPNSFLYFWVRPYLSVEQGMILLSATKV